MAKRFAADRRNTQSYELGVMEEMTIQGLMEVAQMSCEVFPEVHDPKGSLRSALTEMFPHCQALKTSRIARGGDGMVSIGDVVYFTMDSRKHLGEVLAHVLVDNTHWSIVSVWQNVERSQSSSKWTVFEAPSLVPSMSLMASVVFARTGSTAVVLDPPEYR